ncbi:HD domain-containing protein [Halomonas denitrificans]|uniref:HD domain-containing protein n=1 Tax=Halomonas TaxID=2745 RepID=UPI001C94B71B|nr:MULTISPECIES: HD domain-containing protein [Halomonas]MBY5927752.1 HD domain-containing protein [Halomonas sp. DP8Y7-3]MBY6029587.1 HD domain-containing protein [Halomonas sp. DP8Y7-1]MCA0973503.1 HD domain-containing protein [Halomonas denitrificans]MED5295629.1 HD domain-containing protein [Pseudomonadota bacterium]
MTATDSTLSSQAKQAEQAKQTEQATFARFDESTAAEWRLIDQHFRAYQDDACRRVLDHLARLKGDTHGYPVDRYEHCLQTATRALRDGADEEMVVCALLHDIGDDLAPANHAEIAAAILEPFVDPLNVWMIRHHELFQGYHYRHFFGQDRHAREAYRDHPAYARTVRFCDEWDQTSFDPDYDTLPLSAFLPMIQRVMQRPPFGGLPDVVDDPQERA